MKKQYVKPSVQVVKFRTERGYASSGGGILQSVMVMFESDNSGSFHESEYFGSHSTWTEDDKNSFWN